MSVKDDAMKTQEKEVGKVTNETELAAHEWGIKNNLQLFGISLENVSEPGKDAFKFISKAYYIDPGYENMTILHFDIKDTNSNATIVKPEILSCLKYPIKFARTKSFDNECIEPIFPLYWELASQGIILPFRSLIKRKEWAALPFEDGSKINPTTIIFRDDIHEYILKTFSNQFFMPLRNDNASRIEQNYLPFEDEWCIEAGPYAKYDKYGFAISK